MQNKKGRPRAAKDFTYWISLLLIRLANANPIDIPTTGIGFNTKFMTTCAQVDGVFDCCPGLPTTG